LRHAHGSRSLSIFIRNFLVSPPLSFGIFFPFSIWLSGWLFGRSDGWIRLIVSMPVTRNEHLLDVQLKAGCVRFWPPNGVALCSYVQISHVLNIRQKVHHRHVYFLVLALFHQAAFAQPDVSRRMMLSVGHTGYGGETFV
jgi:hypothetical protein